jgi:hypothetical protein
MELADANGNLNEDSLLGHSTRECHGGALLSDDLCGLGDLLDDGLSIAGGDRESLDDWRTA